MTERDMILGALRNWIACNPQPPAAGRTYIRQQGRECEELIALCVALNVTAADLRSAFEVYCHSLALAEEPFSFHFGPGQPFPEQRRRAAARALEFAAFRAIRRRYPSDGWVDTVAAKAWLATQPGGKLFIARVLG